MTLNRWLRAGAIALIAAAESAIAADKPIQIDWDDLLPAAERAADPLTSRGPRGIVEHGAMMAVPAPRGLGLEPPEDPAPLVGNYDGKSVRIAGFIVPFDFSAGLVKEFLLVPYVGACVHVPPPPANQIIFVTSKKGVSIKGLFDPVWITGTFSSAQTLRTDLAEVGYQMTADKVEAY